MDGGLRLQRKSQSQRSNPPSPSAAAKVIADRIEGRAASGILESGSHAPRHRRPSGTRSAAGTSPPAVAVVSCPAIDDTRGPIETTPKPQIACMPPPQSTKPDPGSLCSHDRFSCKPIKHIQCLSRCLIAL